MGKHGHKRKSKKEKRTIRKETDDDVARPGGSKFLRLGSGDGFLGDEELSKEAGGEDERKASTLPREEWMTQPKQGWLSTGLSSNQKKRQDPPQPREAPSHGPGLHVPGGGQEQTSSGRCKVGDGGSGWRLKALKRMQERSKAEGKSLHEIAVERGMDLEALEKEAAVVHRHGSRRRDFDDRSWTKRPRGRVSVFEKRNEEEKTEPTALNRFPNDGSFLETFAKMHEKDARGERSVEEPNVPSNNTAAAEALRRRLASDPASSCPPPKHLRPPLDASTKRRETSDDIMDLHERTRIDRDADIDARLADNIVRRRRFDLEDLDPDIDDDIDLVNFERRRQKKSKRSKKPYPGHRRMETVQERCPYCFDNPVMPKHLVVSIATLSYLRLPEGAPLTTGHCRIVPVEHLPTTREVDDYVWTEIRNFKKALIQMHQRSDKGVIFLESAVRLRDQKRHAYVDCIPVEREIFQKAPVYFKKAIDDATEDWSTHHSKRCIETGTKGLRGSIPPHFPYFHVEFNLQSGFVHVIDDEDNFDEDMGRKVLISLMQLPVEEMHRRKSRTSIDEQKQSVEEFLKAWHAYDWTRQL